METRNNINPRPFQPVSPGCILKEELEARSLPISDFAHKIGLEEFDLDKLLNGTLCLSPEIASSLERFLGIPASFWLSLQSAYEEDLDKSDNKGMVRTFLNKFTRNRVAFKSRNSYNKFTLEGICIVCCMHSLPG